MEVAALGWRTSSYRTSEANCVEVALDGPVLAVPAVRWSAFLRGIAASDFDR